jgi:galactokinase
MSVGPDPGLGNGSWSCFEVQGVRPRGTSDFSSMHTRWEREVSMDARSADDRAVELFRRRHGRDPEVIVRSPGRVNLIGEHTDYNDGFVLPAAIDRGVWVALAATDEPVVDLVSEGFEPVRLPLSGGEPPEGWGIHPVGIAAVLREAGRDLHGWCGAIASDLPAGGGLSSSAALDLALARAFHAVSGFDWDPIEMARAGQRVENDWLGVASGIMDQVACASGRAGHALLLDCRSLDITPVALPSDVALVVLDTATRRELTGSEYNDRRRQCEEAAAAFGVAALRDVTPDDLDAHGSALTPVQLRRARCSTRVTAASATTSRCPATRSTPSPTPPARRWAAAAPG